MTFHDLVSPGVPILRRNADAASRVDSGGSLRQVEAQAPAYRLGFADKHWELVLGNDFISLVCTRYDTREEFWRRFLLAMEAASQCLDIVCWGRLGLRYVNRGPEGENNAREQYSRMLKPEYRGIPGTALVEKATNCLFSAEWDLDGIFASVRHRVPGGRLHTYDPFSVPPKINPGWILDLDIYLQPERTGKVGILLFPVPGPEIR